MRNRLIAGVFLLLAGLQVHAQQRKVTITVTLNAPAKEAAVNIAPLRYDKHFACSFTLDDGMISAARVALPFFNGGNVSAPFKDQWGFDEGGDGTYHAGLFYTDGCGNALPFKVAVAINARSIREDSLPVGLSWRDLERMTKAGWELLNHSNTHATGKEVKATWEVEESTRTVQQRMGKKMLQFVIPGGKDDNISLPFYTEAAFAHGLQVVHSAQYPDYWIEPSTRKDWNRLLIGRYFLNSKTKQMKESIFKEIKEHLATGKRYWLNAFTHSVGNDDLWGISFRYPEFSAFFNELAASYGKDGEDNLWFAPPEAVHGYEAIRREVKPQIARSGNKITIQFDTAGLPDLDKYNALTFLVDSKATIKNVEGTNCTIESFGGKGKLVNITW